MKSIISILFAVFILIAGMKPTLSTHYCCGKIAGVKLTLTGEHASCGMICSDAATRTNTLNPVCCRNELTTCSVDNSYFQASIPFKALSFIKTLNYIPTPETLSKSMDNLVNVMVKGPPIITIGSVSLPVICSFRI